MKYIKTISFFVVLSIIITLVAKELDSDFLFEYLKDNIVGLLLTLLAINTATSGLIASKMQDLVQKFPTFDFAATIREMKISLLEQIVLIVLSVVTLIIKTSHVITYDYMEIICDVLLLSILIYAISILWDTGKGVFIIIDEIQKMNKK